MTKDFGSKISYKNNSYFFLEKRGYFSKHLITPLEKNALLQGSACEPII